MQEMSGWQVAPGGRTCHGPHLPSLRGKVGFPWKGKGCEKAVSLGPQPSPIEEEGGGCFEKEFVMHDELQRTHRKGWDGGSFGGRV